MANSNEIFSKFFNDNEKEKVEKKIEDLGLREKIDSLKIVDQKLNNLKARTIRTPENFEDRFNAYKDAILKLEQEKGLVEKIKDKAKGKIDSEVGEIGDKLTEEGEKFTEEGEKFIEEKFPLWGKIKLAFEKIGEVFEKKGFWAGTLSVLGLIFLKPGEKLWDKLTSFFGGPKEAKAGEIPEEVKVVKEEEEGKEDSLTESVETLTKDKYSFLGLTLLTKACSIYNYETKSPKALFSKISGKNFLELKKDFLLINSNGKMKEEEVESFKKRNPDLKNYKNEDIYEILKVFFASETTSLIYNNRLSKEKIKKIFSENKQESLEKILGKDKVVEIKNKDYDFRKLDLKTITNLIGLSYKELALTSLSNLVSSGKSFFKDLFFGKNDLFSNLKEELKKRKEDLLPIKVLGCFSNKFKASEEVDFGIDDIDTTNLLDPELKKLEEFLEFKKEVLDFMRSKNNKFSLGLDSFTENFNKVINLEEILYLYYTFNGKTDFLNTQDSLIKGGIYAWLYKLFDDIRDSNFSGIYASALKNNVRTDSTKYLSENDKLFINIFIYRVTDVYLIPFQKGLERTEGFVRGEIIDILVEAGFTKEIADDITWVIEGGITLGSFFVFKRFKYLRFLSYSAIPYLLTILFLKGYNNRLKDKISERNYKIFEEGIDMLIKSSEDGIKLESTDSETGQKMITTVKSLKEAKDFLQNPREAKERKNSIQNYILKDGKLILDEGNQGTSVDRNEIIFQVNGNNNDYKIKFRGKTYKVEYEFSLKGVIYSNSYNGTTLNFFETPTIEENNFTWKDGTNEYKLTFLELENILRRNKIKNFLGKEYYFLKKGDWYPWGNDDILLVLQK